MLRPTQTEKIRSILEALATGSKMATDLPHFANELLMAEEAGLCRAVCIYRTMSSNPGDHSQWRWTIEPAGKQWLRDNPQEVSQQRSNVIQYRRYRSERS
jgi:hypothetical protein